MGSRARALCLTALLLTGRPALAAEPEPESVSEAHAKSEAMKRGGGTEPRSRGETKLLETSSLVLEVESRGAAAKVVGAARALGGHEIELQDAHVVVDVPTAEHGRFVDRLTKLGRVRELRRSSEDLTKQHAESEATARARRASRERLERLSSRTVLVGEKLAIEREIRRVTEEIMAAEARARDLEARTRLTRVRVRIDAPPMEGIPAPVLPIGWLDRLGVPHLANPPPPDTPHDRELRAFIDLNAQLALAHVADADALDGTTKLGAGLIAFRTLGEANPIGLFGGFDLALGYGGGFLYGVQPLIGLGVPIGTRLAFGLSTGPGISGISGKVPFGVDAPVELYVWLDAASWMSAAAWARNGWVLASEDRQDGSESALFGDELATGLSLAFGTRGERSYTEERFGPVVGFAYRELMGAKVYELRLGWGGHSSDLSY